MHKHVSLLRNCLLAFTDAGLRSPTVTAITFNGQRAYVVEFASPVQPQACFAMAPAPMGVQQVFFNSLPMSQMANQAYQPVEAEIPQGTLGRDKRLSRVYNHTFADYGTYNFTSRAWPGIDRRSLASLTADEFRERYVEGRTPVILTDISPLREWSLERLRKECGRMEVSFARRYSAGLRAIPEWARRIFLDPRTIKAYNKSTAEIIDAMHAEKTLQEYLSSLESDKEAILTAKDNINLYGGNIVDYLFPVMLSAQHIDKHDCRPLMQAAEAREDRPTYASMHPALSLTYGMHAHWSCSYLEELQDYPPWAKKCAALEEIMNREDAR
ncbi:unnamed protein product [Effrenium voratum]|nr:unnamed protein product [Effrenium voratum]